MTRYEYLASRVVEPYGGLLGTKCHNCNGKSHPYMVKFSLWRKVVPKDLRPGLVCIPCFEGFLGRDLVADDFIKNHSGGGELPINHGIFGFHMGIFLNLPKESVAA